jgi:NAD(P)-dependent dehydrogenase (short-subunit alcohol dehydrogenase family)
MAAKPVVIVTGGTFGIGRAITAMLARRSFQVIAFGLEKRQISSVAENPIPSLRSELERERLQVDLLEADVSRSQEVEEVVSFAIGKYGRIDALVNNAAIGPLGTVLETSEEAWDRVVDVNLKGVFLCCKATIPHMIRQNGGSIIIVGSGAGWGKPNMIAYAASKGGLFAFASALAYDHFHQRIRVNTVVPGGGGIVSGMSLGRVGGDPGKLNKTASGTAAGRVATGDDVAKAVAFLLSDDAEAISGTVIDVGCFAHRGGPIPREPSARALTGRATDFSSGRIK